MKTGYQSYNFVILVILANVKLYPSFVINNQKLTNFAVMKISIQEYGII